VIPVRYQGDEFQFLLVQHHAGHWAFPKGHAEEGETDLQAARRELMEETAVKNVLLLEDVSMTETYFFRRGAQTVAKTVRYFLGLVRDGAVRIQTAEIKAYRWVIGAEAANLITFEESKRLLNEARRYLEMNCDHIVQLLRQAE
jgi:8-oxo-dGTP pyrophosphatase MutT (NUDIX family)